MNVVKCEDCAEFKHPPGDSSASTPGNCQSYDKGIASGKTKPEIDRAYHARGNCPFVGCTRRFCRMFKSISR